MRPPIDGGRCGKKTKTVYTAHTRCFASCGPAALRGPVALRAIAVALEATTLKFLHASIEVAWLLAALESRAGAFWVSSKLTAIPGAPLMAEDGARDRAAPGPKSAPRLLDRVCDRVISHMVGSQSRPDFVGWCSKAYKPCPLPRRSMVEKPSVGDPAPTLASWRAGAHAPRWPIREHRPATLQGQRATS